MLPLPTTRPTTPRAVADDRHPQRRQVSTRAGRLPQLLRDTRPTRALPAIPERANSAVTAPATQTRFCRPSSWRAYGCEA